jgi:hypothetical protein
MSPIRISEIRRHARGPTARHPAEKTGEHCECHVNFPESTLPAHLRGVFLVSMEHRILAELGEAPPFKTRLLQHTRSGLGEIEPSSHAWNEGTATVYLQAEGPHAREVSLMLAGLVDHVLRTTIFDRDGFVVAR